GGGGGGGGGGVGGRGRGRIGRAPASRDLVAELRELGRRYIRPMGLEADRTGEPPPADHPFYRLCARRGGLVDRTVGPDDRGGRDGTGAPTWRPPPAPPGAQA